MFKFQGSWRIYNDVDGLPQKWWTDLQNNGVIYWKRHAGRTSKLVLKREDSTHRHSCWTIPSRKRSENVDTGEVMTCRGGFFLKTSCVTLSPPVHSDASSDAAGDSGAQNTTRWTTSDLVDSGESAIWYPYTRVWSLWVSDKLHNFVFSPIILKIS